MNGERVLYPFGTDDNGLPTEKLVEKENNVSIFSMQRQDFIKLCQETIKKLRPAFIQDWKNLGMSCDFNLEYSTISQDVQIISQGDFIDLYEKIAFIVRKRQHFGALLAKQQLRKPT